MVMRENLQEGFNEGSPARLFTELDRRPSVSAEIGGLASPMPQPTSQRPMTRYEGVPVTAGDIPRRPIERMGRGLETLGIPPSSFDTGNTFPPMVPGFNEAVPWTGVPLTGGVKSYPGATEWSDFYDQLTQAMPWGSYGDQSRYPYNLNQPSLPSWSDPFTSPIIPQPGFLPYDPPHRGFYDSPQTEQAENQKKIFDYWQTQLLPYYNQQYAPPHPSNAFWNIT